MILSYPIDLFDAQLVITDYAHNMGILDELHCARTRITGDNGLWNVMIYLPRDCLRVACHESVHGAYMLLQEINIDTSHANQELVAWVTDFIFSKCMDFLHEKQQGCDDAH